MPSTAPDVLSCQTLAHIGATEEGTFRNHTVRPGGRIHHSVYVSSINDAWPRVRAHLEGLMASYRAMSGTGR